MAYSPKISIITPTLNAAATIEANLQNVAEQTYTNIEHIIIDGISTDSTEQIVAEKSFRYHHIRYIREKDSGLYDAMNKGILASQGDYLFFLGSDDIFHDKNVLSDLVKMKVFDGHKVVYGNVKIVGDTGWAKDGDIYDGSFTKKRLMRQNICHQAIFYPRQLVLKNGLYEIRYKINADWDMNWRLRALTEFVYANRVISVFYAGGHSTNSVDEAFKGDYMKKLQQYFNLSLEEACAYGKTSPWGDIAGDPATQGCPNNQSFLMKIKGYFSNIFSD